MDKQAIINDVKEYRKQISTLQKEVDAIKGGQVQSKNTLSTIEQLSTKWFEDYEPVLKNSFKLAPEIIEKYRSNFGQLLEVCDGKPSKKNILNIFNNITTDFHSEIVVPIQMYQKVLLKFPEFDNLLDKLSDVEKDYLSEAIECARLGKLRASIILGWSAAVSRLHSFIEKNGFDKFNEASVQMNAIQSGRYKRFSKKFEIHNLSELRMTVFDNDLLWVLEFLGAIDGNQHEKLEICFTMRNTSAHPGEAIYTDENVLSFFSDLDHLVFSNIKFKL